MFNNVVLDVFIGLIFIFILYSLLATAINEFIATLFAYRSRMLEKAIEQMMDGKNFSYYWWDKVLNIIRWLFSKKKIQTRFAGNSLEETRISLKDFLSSNTINDTIQKAAKPATYIKRNKLNKKAELFASKIVNHPLYRRKAEDSILYKKPAYLRAEAFSDILIDILSSNKSSLDATPVLMNDIRKFVNTEINNNPSLQKILNLYIEQANGDLQKFKLLLENWFDDTMERVTGWYKKQANKILLLIGFCLAIAFNVSTIAIVSKLSKDKNAREALVQNASDYVKAHYINEEGKIATNNTPPEPGAQGVTTSIDNTNKKDGAGKKNPDSTSNKKDSTSKTSSDSGVIITTHDDSLQRRAKQQLQEIKELYEKSIEENNTVAGLGWGDYGYTGDSINYKASHHIDNYALYRDSIEINVKDTNDFKQKNKIQNFKEYKEQALKNMPPHPKERGIWGKLFFILGQTFSNPKLLLGFLITAFAVSLGAPFWFDLLNKFVNLRAAGVKPDSDKANTSKTISLNSKPDPDSVG